MGAGVICAHRAHISEKFSPARFREGSGVGRVGNNFPDYINAIVLPADHGKMPPAKVK